MDAPAYSLRPVRADDREFVERVYFETQRWIIEALFGWSDDETERANFADTYDEEHTQIVVVDGQDVGWLTVQRTRDIHLDSIYLVPSQQRKGIGTALLRSLIAEADKSGSVLRLSTAKINPARRLYERLGFIVVDEGPYKIHMERRRR
jgi:ribosomal protein S18 acetylase RimI-like enzyme